MAETDSSDGGPASDERTADSRFAALDLAHGDTVIYDRDNPQAWLQSDGAVSMESMA